MSPHTPTTWMTTAEAAEYLRYQSTQGVRDAVRRGSLRAHRRGRTYLFHREDLDAYLRSQSISPKYSGATVPARKSGRVGASSQKCTSEAPLQHLQDKDPYGLQAALTVGQAERDPESCHRTRCNQPSQNPSKEGNHE